MRSTPWTLASLALALVGLSAGCYERVVSEKPFPGMRSTRSDVPTAYDYSSHQPPEPEKPFDPIGDWIVRPIGGVFDGIGNALSPSPPAQPPPISRPVTGAGSAGSAKKEPAKGP